MSAALTSPDQPSRTCTCTCEEAVVIRLPGEPRGKGRHRSRIVHGAAGQSFIRNHPDAKTEAYEGRLKRAAADALGGDRPLLSGAIAVAVWSYRVVPASFSKRKRELALADQLRPTTKPDWDNYAKICDALNGIVWVDDALVVKGFVEKLYAEKPCLVIRVEPWVPAPLPAIVAVPAVLPLLEGATA